VSLRRFADGKPAEGNRRLVRDVLRPPVSRARCLRLLRSCVPRGRGRRVLGERSRVGRSIHGLRVSRSRLRRFPDRSCSRLRAPAIVDYVRVDRSDCHRGWSLRSWRNGHSADTADKARIARLQVSGNALAGGRFGRVCFVTAMALVGRTAIDFPLQPSGPCFVRCVRLCPFLHERRSPARAEWTDVWRWIARSVATGLGRDPLFAAERRHRVRVRGAPRRSERRQDRDHEHRAHHGA